jgi:hypothetical protein
LRGALDGGFDVGAESDARLDRRGLAAHDADGWRPSAERLQQGEHRIRRHGMGVGRLPLRDGRVWSNHDQIAWRTAMGQRIDEDHLVVPVEHLARQMESANAEVGGNHSERQRLPRQVVGDLDAEPVVAEKDVADARDEHFASHGAASNTTTSP